MGVVKFAKLDTDAEPVLAQGLGVQALPTVLMFYKGQLVNAAEGALPASQFQAWLYQTLTAVRQYEKQLSAEAEDAIAAATQNLSSLRRPEPEPADPCRGRSGRNGRAGAVHRALASPPIPIPLPPNSPRLPCSAASKRPAGCIFREKSEVRAQNVHLLCDVWLLISDL